MSGEPYEVLESSFLRMQQRKAVVQTKIKNLITGKVLDRNFQPSDQFEEVEIEKKKSVFIYSRKGEFWFHETGKPSERFSLAEDVVGSPGQFLKSGTEVELSFFKEKVIRAFLPVKMDLKVTEAPPAIRGDTAQGGTKTVTLETGAKISTPLFIEEGDIVRVNTETGEYAERAEKK